MAEETPPIVELAEWFQTPPGQYVLAWERAQFDAAVADVFGYYARQVGLADWNLLRANRMPFKGCVGTEAPAPEHAEAWQSRVVLAQPEALPFESQSVDLLVLPHAFECTAEPHNVLREVERVLVPEGRVVISGFNPWSMWGARAHARHGAMAAAAAVVAGVAASAQDWFKLLSLEVKQSHFGCYAPACRSENGCVAGASWNRPARAGGAWAAPCIWCRPSSGCGMRIIGPAWNPRKRAAPLPSWSTARPTKTGRAPEPAAFANRINRTPASLMQDSKPIEQKVEMWTDGACKGNPGPGGWGVLMRAGAHEKTLHGGERQTTNNRMELLAVIEGLRALKRSCVVTIHTDSQYVMKGMTEWLANWKRRGWITADKKPVKNAELWQALDEQVGRHQVSWRWVKGHAGDPGNERADQLANQGVEVARRS